MTYASAPFITVSPPLVVQTDDLSVGLLVGIHSDALEIKWTKVPPHGDLNVSIRLPSGRHLSLICTHTTEGYRPKDAPQKAQLIDLLHIMRKEQHIDICATQNVEHSTRRTGFEDIKLPHVALPELSWSHIDTTRRFMGQSFGAPYLITGMTGGVDQAAGINSRLAEAASAFRIPMGVGSQRIALENPAHAGIFELKKNHPKLFLIGNLGIGQFTRADFFDLCRRAVEMIDADGLAIHVNVLQELVQVEGDRDFRGILDRIAYVAEHLGRPLLVKEVGAGMDAGTIQKLYERNIRAIDVGGAGGTSWAHIEGLRSLDLQVQRLGRTFRDWGIPTAEALAGGASLNLPGLELVATGGMRDGVTALKALFHGATMVGVGLPLFKAALKSADSVHAELNTLVTELKIAMMCSGTPTLPKRL